MSVGKHGSVQTMSVKKRLKSVLLFLDCFCFHFFFVFCRQPKQTPPDTSLFRLVVGSAGTVRRLLYKVFLSKNRSNEMKVD